MAVDLGALAVELSMLEYAELKVRVKRHIEGCVRCKGRLRRRCPTAVVLGLASGYFPRFGLSGLELRRTMDLAFKRAT